MMSQHRRNATKGASQAADVALLLLVGGVCCIEATIAGRGGLLGLVGLAPSGICLAGIARFFGRRSFRELLRIAQGAVMVVALAALVGVALGPRLGLYRTLTVLSGSMRPTFNPGDVIVVRPEPLRDIRVGQVVSFTIPTAGHELVTHRIIRVLKAGNEPVVQTRGDANNIRDPWTATLHGKQAWRLSLVIPRAGYLLVFLRDPLVHKIAIFVAPALLALLGIAQVWGLSLPRRTRRITDAAGQQ
jgi:signal peptidase I